MNEHYIIDVIPPKEIGELYTHTEFNAFINYTRALNYDALSTVMDIFNDIAKVPNVVFKGIGAPSSATPSDPVIWDTYLATEAGTVFGTVGVAKGDILTYNGATWDVSHFELNGLQLVARLSELQLADKLPTSAINHNGVTLDTVLEDSIIEVFTISEDGLVPAPITEDGKFLKDDGTWSEIITVTGDLTSVKPGIVTINNGTGSVLGTGTSIDITQATDLTDGYLSKEDWVRFDGNLGVQEVTSSNTTILSITDPTTVPILTINTGTVTAISDLLTTGAQVNAFVIGQNYLVDADIAGKEDTLTKGNVSAVGPIVVAGEKINAVIGTGISISIPQATELQDGYISKEDIIKYNALATSSGTVKTISSLDGLLDISSDPEDPTILVRSAIIANGNIFLTTGDQVYNFVYGRDISIFNNDTGYITNAEEIDPVWESEKHKYFNKETDTILIEHIPDRAITNVFEISSEGEQESLTAEEGDIAIRSDILTSFVHNGGTSLTMADWSALSFDISTLTTDDIDEGVINKYYTEARVSANTDVAANTAHRSLVNNPHIVTQTQVGLGNVDNTSDLDKPISTATQTALDTKINGNTPITGDTKTKITYDSKGLVLSGVDATTADIASVLDIRYVTDADLVVIANTSGINTGDQDLTIIEDQIADNAADILFNAVAISDLQEEQVVQNETLVPYVGADKDVDLDLFGIRASTFSYVTSYISTGNEEAGVIHWNSRDHTLNIPTGFGPIIQVGMETLIHVYNANAFTMLNGKAVYPVGTSTNGLPNIGYAITSSWETIVNQVGLLTSDIPPGEDGFVTIVGSVRSINTSSLSPGPVYISDTVAGDLTSIKPTFPNYEVQMGVVTKVDADEGSIITDIRDNIQNSLANFWNGTIRESFFFDVVDNGGGGLKGQLLPANGHPNLTALLSDGLYTIITTPPLEVALNVGTIETPQMNYVYFLGSTKTLTVSTSGFPTDAEHIKIGSYYLQSAVITLGNGPLKSHPWNDHLVSNHSFQGHLSHITQRLRQEGAKWKSGVEAGSTIVSPTEAYITTTGGIVYQLHEQVFPTFDTQLVDQHFHVWNGFTNPFAETSNIYDIVLDSNGGPLNNSSFSLILFGSVNSGSSTSNYSQLFIGVPAGVYPKNSPDLAISDAFNYSNYTIPAEFRGTGFLIARYTFIRQANGDLSLYDIQDLTDSSAVGGGGGGGIGGGVTTFVALTDTPNLYPGSENYTLKVGAGGAGVEFINVIESVSKSSVATEFLNSYDSLTGLFTSVQPQYSEIANTPDLTVYWKNDGTSTATADWDIGAFDLSADNMHIANYAVENDHAVRYDQMTGLIGGLDWKDSVKEIFNPTGGLPIAPNDMDRYISSATANGWTIDQVYEWSTSLSMWVEFPVNEGSTCWVEDSDTNFTFNGVYWAEFGSTVSHNNTSGLQGGIVGEYFHLSEAQYNALPATFDLQGVTDKGATTTNIITVGGLISPDVTLATTIPTLYFTDVSASNTWRQFQNNGEFFIEPETVNGNFYIRNLANASVFTIDTTTGNGIFTGTLNASNLSGTNTGDQDLTNYVTAGANIDDNTLVRGDGGGRGSQGSGITLNDSNHLGGIVQANFEPGGQVNINYVANTSGTRIGDGVINTTTINDVFDNNIIQYSAGGTLIGNGVGNVTLMGAQVRVMGYGDGLITGTPTYGLSVDTNGFIIETSLNPISHASDHENGGADEIDVTDLSGVLADNQPFDDSALVPYTGANQAVNLNTQTLTAGIGNFSGKVTATDMELSDVVGGINLARLVFRYNDGSGNNTDNGGIQFINDNAPYYSEITGYRGVSSTQAGLHFYTTNNNANPVLALDIAPDTNVTFSGSVTAGTTIKSNASNDNAWASYLDWFTISSVAGTNFINWWAEYGGTEFVNTHTTLKPVQLYGGDGTFNVKISPTIGDGSTTVYDTKLIVDATGIDVLGNVSIDSNDFNNIVAGTDTIKARWGSWAAGAMYTSTNMYYDGSFRLDDISLGGTVLNSTSGVPLKVRYAAAAANPVTPVTVFEVTTAGNGTFSGSLSATLASAITSDVVYYNSSTGLFTYGVGGAGGGSQNLQEVTDLGATTTNNIKTGVTGTGFVETGLGPRVSTRAEIHLNSNGDNPSEIFFRDGTSDTGDTGALWTFSSRGGAGTNNFTIYSAPGATGGAFLPVLDMLPTGGSTFLGYVKAGGLNNVTPASEVTQIDGYGILGNRADFYISNGHATGAIRFGVGGVHSTNSMVTVRSEGVTINSTVAATEELDVHGGMRTTDGTNGCTMVYNTTSKSLDFNFN